jgi:hypothetical protein
MKRYYKAVGKARQGKARQGKVRGACRHHHQLRTSVQLVMTGGAYSDRRECAYVAGDSVEMTDSEKEELDSLQMKRCAGTALRDL